MIAYRYFLLGAACFLGSLGLAQNNPANLTDHQMAQRALFSQIPQSRLHQSTLLNRNLSIHPSVLEVNGSNQSPAIGLEEWMKLQEDLWMSLSDQDLIRKPSPKDFQDRLKNFFRPLHAQDNYAEVPVGVLDFEVTNIAQEAFDEGRIALQNNVFVPQGLNQQDYELREVFSVVPIISGLTASTMTFVFDPQFWFTNRSDAPTKIEVDFGDGRGYQRVQMGDRVQVTYATEAVPTWQVVVRFDSGKLKKAAALSDPLIPSANVPFNEVFTITLPSGEAMEVGIWNSPCHQGLTKPFIVAHGLLAPGPASLVKILAGTAGADGGGLATVGDVTLSTLYHKFNYSSQMDALRAAGNDIVILRLKDRYMSIQLYGELVAAAIKVVNYKKQLNGSHFENSAVGFSLGGMALRYALNKMEEDLMDGENDLHHHTRIFTSYDVGHLGNNIPLGVQAGVGYAVEDRGESGLRLNLMYYLLNTHMAKSAAIYHYSIPFATGGNEAPHPLRTDLVNKLHNQVHDETVVTGYPAFSRNIAVSQGDRRGIEDPPYSFADVSYFYKRSGWAKADVYVRPMTPSATYLTYSPVIGMADWFHASSSALSVDNSPGSYDYGLYSNAMTAIKNAYGTLASNVEWHVEGIDSDCKRKTGGPWCFVPVVSGLGLNTDFLGIDEDWDYNIDAGGLMFDSPGNLNPGFGYPAVGHPTDHFSRTPFEGICSVNENSQHIVGFRPEGEPFQPGECEFRFGSLNLHIRARDFMAGEMVPDELRLQNKVIGENTRSDLEYRASYEANANIAFGRQVTWATDRVDYVINSNGHIESVAEDYIELNIGFEAKAGSYFTAEIGEVDCHYVRPADPWFYSGRNYVAAVPEEAPETEALDQTLNESANMALYPNPTEGQFTVALEKMTGPVNLSVFDLQGRQVYSTVFQGQQHIVDLTGHESGIYIVKVFTDELSLVQRIVNQ